MKWLAKICVIGALHGLGAVMCSAQEINFRDLERPGPPAVKRVVIAGSLADANRMYESFADSDSSERSSSSATLQAHSAASDSCRKNSSCYQILASRRDRVEIKCLAGMKRGDTEWISISSGGKYNCNPLGCDKSLHEAALSKCLL